MGNDIKDYTEVSVGIKELTKDDLPFSLALKVESNLVRKMTLRFGSKAKKLMTQ